MASDKLRSNCLNFAELLAQAIALISPTMTAALIIPVMYSNTGDWSWLPYALGTVMLLFVALNPQPIRAPLDLSRLNVCIYLPRPRPDGR